MVLSQSSFVTFYSTHGHLKQFLAFKDLHIQTNLRVDGKLYELTL